MIDLKTKKGGEGESIPKETKPVLGEKSGGEVLEG